jgi:hypothetical protein
MDDTTRHLRPLPAPSAYEQVTRRGLDDLQAQVDRVETKLNGVLTAVVSGVILELVKLVIGG